jgi:hypothetical protein
MTFITLSAELRRRIYHYLFDGQSVPDVPARLDQTPLAICLVCKQLYHETYALAVPVFTSFGRIPVIRRPLRKVLSRAQPVYQPFIKTLCLTIPDDMANTGLTAFTQQPQGWVASRN